MKEEIGVVVVATWRDEIESNIGHEPHKWPRSIQAERAEAGSRFGYTGNGSCGRKSIVVKDTRKSLDSGQKQKQRLGSREKWVEEGGQAG